MAKITGRKLKVNSNNNQKSGSKKYVKTAIHIVLVVFVMILAVWVRARGTGETDQSARESYTDDDGVPYFTDMDSYYHVRLVDNYLNGTGLGDSEKDGKAWDSIRFYPEGQSAEYPPGIVMVTSFVWKIFGGSLRSLEFKISAYFAALTALVAYIIGCRMGSFAGGLGSAILVSCAPQYVGRSCFGRFDTDMFVVLMELLLILFMIETLRTVRLKNKLIFGAAFAAAELLYSMCYAPKNAFLFACLTLAGGVLWVTTKMIHRAAAKQFSFKGMLRDYDFITVVLSSFVCLIIALLLTGGSIINDILGSLSFYSQASGTAASGLLPKISSSISELAGVSFFPNSVSKLFSGYVRGETPTVLNGVGGAGVVIAALLGMIWLAVTCLDSTETVLKRPGRRKGSAYLFVLGVWLAGGLFMVRYGVRFIEHLCVPAGLLAGVFIGAVFKGIFKQPEKEERKKKKKPFPVNLVFALILMAITFTPSITGAVVMVSDIRPSVSDASAEAMTYIKNRSRSEKAVVASWWDMGYFYESEASHPCLFDGGSQDGIRAVLVAKALITEDMELARRIILMLSSTGNAAAEMLMSHTDSKNAFDALYEAIVMNEGEAKPYLMSKCDLTEDEATDVYSLMRPEKTEETYLVITYTMTRQIGWYEYFGGWDFSGDRAMPRSTYYSYTPEGTPVFDTAEGMEYLNNVRGREMMWRLFFDAEQTDCFTPAFEWHDGLEHVRIWRVEQ